MAGQGECCTNIASVLSTLKHGIVWTKSYHVVHVYRWNVVGWWQRPWEVPYAPVSDLDFRSAKKLKQNLGQTINGLTTSEGIARSGEAANVSIPVSAETDLSNFYTELNSCKACVSELDSSFLWNFCFKEQKHISHFRFIWQEVLRPRVSRSVRGMLKKKLSLAMQLGNTVVNMRVLQ